MNRASKKIIQYFAGSIISMLLLTGFFPYVYGDETGEMHGDSSMSQTQEKSAKDMKMGDQEHEVALKKVREKYLERVKKAQDMYTKAVTVAKKEKSKKKEQAAKSAFMKAKTAAQKLYQKERNAAMKSAMKKKK